MSSRCGRTEDKFMSRNSSESFEKAVEELLTRQRVGIGFAITDLGIMVAGESYPFSSGFICPGAKSHRKITKNKARSTDGYNILL